jgi:LysM repeat protein
MPDQGRRSPARILAPLALVVFALVFFAIVLSSGGGGDSGGGKVGGTNTEASRTSTAPKQERTTTEAQGGRATYTVKVGDTLGGIADKTGVPVEKLLELNPDLDPQALVSGQKVKLRE